jgi:hypothetical protein
VSAADPARLLTDALRRESRSLLQYVRAADPWAPAADRHLLTAVREMADKEAATLDRLAAFLQTKRVPLPHLGAFPTAFTSLNFVAVRSLLPRLIKDVGRGLDDVKRAAASLPAEWCGPVEELLAQKQVQLETLRSLAGAAVAP